MQEELMLVEKLHPKARIPEKAHDSDACYDLWTAEDFSAQDLAPGEGFVIPLKLKVAIKPGYCGEIRSRSGIALNGIPARKTQFNTGYFAKIMVMHGTIDSAYRNEIGVLCKSLIRYRNLFIPAGTKIAQLKIERVPEGEVKEVEYIPEDTERKGGFGSTGLN